MEVAAADARAVSVEVVPEEGAHAGRTSHGGEVIATNTMRITRISRAFACIHTQYTTRVHMGMGRIYGRLEHNHRADTREVRAQTH